ncbi:ankyrin repeat-containing domain protein [Xylariaceae sp. FL0255]|nr:ankyrin repeat-containing domain protein [Xylariaceae sp. FL0255]
MQTDSPESHRQESPPPRWSKRPATEELPSSTGSKRPKSDGSHPGSTNRKRLPAKEYTIGWVCALHIEMAAAKCMLDEIHQDLDTPRDDINTYIFGSLYDHNVIIACLPVNGYGTHNAAIVATNMRRTFPSIRTFLMVGIGGGVPGKEKADIRLGDVVVSTGVIQYDLGKTLQQGFQAMGTIRQPSQALMTAVSKLRAYHESEPPKTSLILSQMLDQYPSMAHYANCDQLDDLLFDSAYDHANATRSCDGCDQSRLLSRPSRRDKNPRIHYGIVASGNRVIKDARTRDRLAQQFNASCFEMEAAGMMDNLQCLVIRGICDYSDSHKQKEWQEYASATAAAYVKELLSAIPAMKVQNDAFSSSQTISLETDIVAEDPIDEHRQLLMKALSFDKIDARHSNIKPAYGKTCAWLLSHPDYIEWLNPSAFPQHRGFLWIRGKPGAGKSTIMKYIYTGAQSRQDITISFFFNARGDSLEKSTEGMYRSLLFQLFDKLPELRGVLDDTCSRPQSQDDSWSIDTLQTLLSAALGKLGRRIMCFIDALDECDEEEIRDMVEYFEELSEFAFETQGKFYICFSSRHYPTISIQNGLSLILEDQLGHSQDLEKYVQRKLRAGYSKDVAKIRTELLEKAAGVFMWVVLVVEILNKEYERGRIFSVRQRLRETPAKLSELFKDILKRDTNNMADLLLCIQWILYAKRPLKPEEFYYAVVAGLDSDREELTEWDPEHTPLDAINRFVSSSSKGLAEATKSRNGGTVQFIHESVRDFLLKDGGIQDLWPDIMTNFRARSHDRLKECCNAYIAVDVSAYVSLDQSLPKANSDEAKALRQNTSEKFPFLEYATRNVLYHADAAVEELDQHDFLKNFDIETWINLSNLFEKFENHRYGQHASLPYIFADRGFAELIRILPGCDLMASVLGQRYKYPLFAALANGHRSAVRALLQLSKEPDAENDVVAQLKYGKNYTSSAKHTLVGWSIENRQIKFLQKLIQDGIDVESTGDPNKPSLLLAVENGYIEIVKVLLDAGAHGQTNRFHIRTPLVAAASSGHLQIVKLLLDADMDHGLGSDYIKLPLEAAARNGHFEIIKLLLDGAAHDQANSDYLQQSLATAAGGGHLEIVQLLLESGADLNPKSTYTLSTPLAEAAGGGHVQMVQYLIDMGADVRSRSGFFHRLPLSEAARRDHAEVVELLLDGGADLEPEDSGRHTALSEACAEGSLRAARLLLDRGAHVNWRNYNGQTPLSFAVEQLTNPNRYEIVELLLERGAEIESRDHAGYTALIRAAYRGLSEVVQVLVDKGADIETRDSVNLTPLLRATQGGHIDVVMVLLNKGANIEAADSENRTPLWWAASQGRRNLVQLLLERGADVNVVDCQNRTPQ